MCYDTLGEQVLVSDAYLKALNNPTPWTRQALTWFRNPDRNVYTLLSSRGAAAPSAAPVLAVARFDAGALPAGDLPDGVTRLALYRLDGAGSSVRTQEAGIHGARSAQDGGLLWLECSDVHLLNEPESPPSAAGLGDGPATERTAAAAGLLHRLRLRAAMTRVLAQPVASSNPRT